MLLKIQFYFKQPFFVKNFNFLLNVKYKIGDIHTFINFSVRLFVYIYNTPMRIF